MTTSDESREPAAWGAQQQRWYASLVAQCDGIDGIDSTAAVPTVLATASAKPITECLFMVGDAHLDDRVEDSDGQLWSADRNGRWFTTVKRKKVWLQRQLVWIGYGRLPRGNECVSHICGNCSCIRAQHLRIQSRSEDASDRVYHRAGKRGQIRPREHALESPVPTCHARKHRSVSQVMSP